MPNTVLGKVSCVPRGDYSASTTYTVLDIAGYQGGSYMALKTITGVTPSNDGVNWMQLSGPGLPGEQGEQGEPGEAAGFGQATATVDESTGTPSVDVTTSGPDTAKVFNFAFSGLKGETGAKGDTGDKGDTGATGPQGVSVTDAEINESGRLIITLSAGEPIDAGNAVGPTGAKGDTGATGPEGASVSRIERTSGTGAPGTTDTYTVYLTDGSTGGTFNVYNGSNGTGSGDFMADGSVPMTGALQMGGNKITNLGAPGADTDAVRKQDLDAVAAEVDDILDGTTPAYIPPATAAKRGGVIIGDGLSVEADGTVSADSQLPTGGTTGQLLTKTASGTEWADAPSGLPDGGTTGQMLYKSADGVEWGDKPVMYVNITGDDSSGYAADKMASEIYEAYSNGNAIFAIIGATTIGLYSAATTDGTYSASFLGTYNTTVSIISVVEYSGNSHVNVSSSPISPDAVNVDFTPTSTLTSDNVQDAIEEVQSNIPTDYIPTSEKGANSGVATLGADGVLTESQRPTYTASDVGARPTSWTPTAADVGAVPTSRTVNGKALSANITLNASDVGAATEADVEGAKPMLRTATLTTSGWSSNSQTVTVNGVVANSSAQLIYVSPANKASATAWGEAGVFCSAQGANSLTFTCDSTPSANISVNISIEEART